MSLDDNRLKNTMCPSGKTRKGTIIWMEAAGLLTRYSNWANQLLNSVPVGKLRSTEGSGPIFTDKQSQVAIYKGNKESRW